MIHISFKQKKLRLRGHVVLLKDRGVVVKLGRGTFVAQTESKIRKGLEGDFVL